MMKRDVLSWALLVICLVHFMGYTTSAQEVESSQEVSTAIKTLTATNDLNTFNCPPFIPEGCMITVLHGDPAKGNFDILFKIPENFVVPKHWHTSPERMILLSGTMEVTYDGEPTQTLEVGDYAYGPAKKPHIAKCGDNGPCTLFIAFEEPLDAHEVKD